MDNLPKEIHVVSVMSSNLESVVNVNQVKKRTNVSSCRLFEVEKD